MANQPSAPSDILARPEALDALLAEPQGLDRLLSAAERDLTLAHGILNDTSLAFQGVDNTALATHLARRLPRVAFAALRKEPRLGQVEGFVEALTRDAEVVEWMSEHPALARSLGLRPNSAPAAESLDASSLAREVLSRTPVRSVPPSRKR